MVCCIYFNVQDSLIYFNVQEQFDVIILSYDVLVTDLATFGKIGRFF